MRKSKRFCNSQQLQGIHTTTERPAYKNQMCSHYKHYLLKMTEGNNQSLSSVPFPRSNNLEINSKDELSTCCNIIIKRYRIRRVKTKGSIIKLLVLIVSNLVTSTLHIIATTGAHYSIYQFWLIPFGITTAIAGWLTDAFIGRYKVIQCSVWIMWILMIATVSAIVQQLNEPYHHYNKTIRPALFWLGSIYWPGWISR